MNCREFIEFILDYLDGELAGAVHDAFDGHIRMCPDCLNYLRTYEQTIRLEKTLCCGPDDTLPEGVPEELVRAILEAKKQDESGEGTPRRQDP